MNTLAINIKYRVYQSISTNKDSSNRLAQNNTNFIPLSYIEHVKHEAYVQKRKYLCSVMAEIEKNNNTHTLSHTHRDPKHRR